jgi:hypothetical protein
MKRKSLRLKKEEKKSLSDWLDSINLCPHCNCMTYIIKGKCGKCKEIK